MNYLDLIRNAIEKSLPLTPGDKGLGFSVEIPELEHGDVTSNFCLVAAKKLEVSPQQVFEKVFTKLAQNLQNEVEKIEFKNPGFVNFYFKASFVQNKLNPKKAWWNFWKEEKIVSQKYFGKKVLVEHTSVNLFKPFTVGHLVTNFTGEFVTRAIESVGGQVLAMSYPSDKSIGIAKAIWVIKQDGGIKHTVFKENEDDVVKYLGNCYMLGVNTYKNAEDTGNKKVIEEIKNISNNIFNETPGEDLEIFEYTKKINLNYFEKVLRKMNSKFSNFIFESEAGVVGKKLVMENVGKVFTESEGAIVYIPSEERKDINTTVFVNSEGNPTYAGKDLGLLKMKFKKFSPLDYSIYVTDNEQTPHFKVVFDAASKINKEWSEKSIHMMHGRMTFKGQKMSSRLGGVPTGEEVIQAVYEDVVERSGGKTTDMEVALSALRISILRSKPGVNIDFDPERASSFEGDSGPYLCYTHARCCSLLEKATTTPSPSFKSRGITSIERKVLQFENVLLATAEEIAPQKLVKYLFELSGEFNSFYATNKILDNENVEVTQHNLYLTELVRNTLQKGLYILGITAPEKM